MFGAISLFIEDFKRNFKEHLEVLDITSTVVVCKARGDKWKSMPKEEKTLFVTHY